MLIQKDTKLHLLKCCIQLSLRALLIQKDTKRIQFHKTANNSLRALLIQKDTKPKRGEKDRRAV